MTRPSALTLADLHRLGPDPRLMPWREGCVDQRCIHPTASLYAVPDASSEQQSALLYGEIFEAWETAEGWTWGRCALDGMVGYVASASLAPTLHTPTHWVSVPQAHVFSAPSIKSPPLLLLPLGAQVALEEAPENWRKIAGSGYIRPQCLEDHTAPAQTPLAIAHSLIGSPYLWGGRSRQGIDCSGLVQIALQSCTIACPRDSDQQAAFLGASQPLDTALQSGDLIFFPGHVGIMANTTDLLHANAHWMRVVQEPLADVIARLDRPDALRAIKRL